MTRTWLQAGALGVLLCVCTDIETTGQASYAAEAASPVPSHNGGPSMDSLIVWGLRQFDAAGLSLPRVSSVTFLTDSARCRGYMGWMELGPDGPEVTLCFQADEACDDADCHEWRLPYKIAVLHEFSHAWLWQNISGEQEAEFIRFEGLHSWQDFSVDWFQRGGEQAAITMGIGLLAETLPMTGEECVKRAEGFRILTGASPPAPCATEGPERVQAA